MKCSLAGQVLYQSYLKGNEIKIPKLGITVQKDEGMRKIKESSITGLSTEEILKVGGGECCLDHSEYDHTLSDEFDIYRCSKCGKLFPFDKRGKNDLS